MLKIPPYKTSENRGWLDVREEGRTHTQLECLYMHTHTHTHTQEHNVQKNIVVKAIKQHTFPHPKSGNIE